MSTFTEHPRSGRSGVCASGVHFLPANVDGTQFVMVINPLFARAAAVVFLNEKSLERLVSAVLVEIDDKWASADKAYIK